jgi:hypothetical protein
MSKDCIQNGIDRGHHFSIRETNDREAMLLEIMGSPFVMRCIGFIAMLITVDLENQL